MDNLIIYILIMLVVITPIIGVVFYEYLRESYKQWIDTPGPTTSQSSIKNSYNNKKTVK